MQQLKASIDELDKKINEETQIALQSIEGTYRATVQQEANLAAKLEGAKKAVLDLQDRSIRFNILKREVDTNRQLYDGLLQRLKEVGVEAGVGTNNVTVVDPALPPGVPVQAEPDAEPADRGGTGPGAGPRSRVLPRIPRRHAAAPGGHGAADAPAGAGRHSAGSRRRRGRRRRSSP